MSENGDDQRPTDRDEANGAPDRGQGGQPQGGRPQGGQPGGQGGQSGGQGQPQGGQPGGQGGQPTGQGGQGPPGGQGQAQGGQPAGGQPAGQQQAGRQAQRGPSLADELQRPAVMDQLKSGVATFALIGFGIGLTAMFMLTLIGSVIGTAILGYSAVMIVLLVGPVLAALFSLRIDEALDEDTTTVAVAAALVGAVGFFAMGFIAEILVVLGAGSGVDFADALVQLILGMIAPAIVGAAVPFLQDTLLAR